MSARLMFDGGRRSRVANDPGRRASLPHAYLALDLDLALDLALAVGLAVIGGVLLLKLRLAFAAAAWKREGELDSPSSWAARYANRAIPIKVKFSRPNFLYCKNPAFLDV